MCTYTHGCHTMVPETSQATCIQAHFLYNTFYVYLLTNLLISVTLSINKFSSGG